MRKLVSLLAASVLLLCGQAYAGNTYYADPAKGAADGDGSAAKPWKTLEEVVKSGKLKTLQGGDTLLLNTGYHGNVSFSGDNESPVTIAAGKDQKPTLSRLTITKGKNWVVKGLSISPSFGEEGYKGNIVTYGESGASSNISIEDCYIFTAADSSAWGAAEWMAANSGVLMGRNGKDMTIRNCFVKNVRHGIALCSFDALCEGNVVTDYSADGIRATRDGQTVQYNVIKNIYVSAKDGDDNHDDGIQVFLFNKGTGTVRNIKLIGNVIIAHEDPDQKLKNTLQGIGLFDGPLVDFVVTDNVIAVDSWHGLSLYDAQNCKIERNVVWTPEGKMRAWIMLGTKQKLAKDNTVKDNFAPTFNLKQPGTIAENNKPATLAIYEAALKKAMKTIDDKFGAKHVAADHARLGSK